MYLQEPVNHIRSWVEVTSQTYHVRIDRDIEEASRFQEEIVQIRQATSQDRIHVYVNSNGGALSTMGSILSALEQSPARITCELELDAASAGSFIFLAGDEFIVSDNASMMIHELQAGTGGTMSNMKRYTDHIASQNERLVRKYYKNFLSEDEISDVLSGGELYLNADDIVERLTRRQEALEEEHQENQLKEEQAFQEAMMGEVIPSELLENLDKETLIKTIQGTLSEEEEESLFGKYYNEESGEFTLPEENPSEEGLD